MPNQRKPGFLVKKIIQRDFSSPASSITGLLATHTVHRLVGEIGGGEMELEFKWKCLIALLADGKEPGLHIKTGMDLLCEDRGWEIPVAPHPSIDDIEERKEVMIALRILLVALRLGDRKLLQRALRLSARLGLERPDGAVPLLQANCGASVAPTLALREYFSSPAFLEHLRDRVQPEPKRSIADVSPSRYRHPEDLQATAEMERKTPFEGLARLMSKELSERAFAIRNAATSIRVGPKQFPDLHRRFSRICERMGLEPVPPFFLARGDINAFTGGVEEPFVVLHQGVLSKLGPAEQDFIIGHEIGHIKFDHVLYQMIARLLMMQGMLLTPNLVLSRILAQGMQLRILDWSRKAELSCDRAGLLACQDPNAALRVMLRFAGVPASRLDELNIAAYLEQYEVLEDASSSRIGKLFSGLYESHPWIIERVKKLKEWVDSGSYHGLLHQSPLERGPMQSQEERMDDLIGQLAMAGIGERWLEALSGRSTESQWSLGERRKERLQAGGLVESCGHWREAGTESPLILLPKDRAIYSLNAHALLSMTEKEQLGQIAAVPALEWAAAIWGVEDLPEEDRIELERRAKGFVLPLNGEVFFMDREGREQLQAWAGRKEEDGKSVADILSENQSCLPDLDTQSMERLHRDALKAAQSVLEQGFTELEEGFSEWFRPMDTEERRHEGARRLLEAGAGVLQAASEAYWSFLPRAAIGLRAPKLHLSRRNQEISRPLVAAGVGCLAFGTLLFPAAPLWFSLSGVGLGLASMASGQRILGQQAQDLAEGQISQVSDWLSKTKGEASASLQEVATAQLEGLLQALGKGWEPILAEAAIQREAIRTQAG
jgi:Zn-dependent protease with chaperone function